MSLGAIVVLVYAVATRQSFKIYRGELLPLTLLGVLFTVQLGFMNVGQDYTSAGHAVVVTSTFPLWTGVFAHFFVPGDQMSRTRTFGTLIAYSGVVAVFYKSFAISNADFFSWGFTVTWFGYIAWSATGIALTARTGYRST
ncbi:MAG: hypothetical protein Ct9H300mP19_00630 [Dehalococcoidia bacterium]|nr:MAG: hypothetical protein Ct9H300mP19_00630 [Dehalococcoidia bacterium]